MHLEKIKPKDGMIDIKEVASKLSISERHLERSFKKATGATPKFYSRVIRFSHMFSIIQDRKDSWVRIALASGYFDQSHFNNLSST